MCADERRGPAGCQPARLGGRPSRRPLGVARDVSAYLDASLVGRKTARPGVRADLVPVDRGDELGRQRRRSSHAEVLAVRRTQQDRRPHTRQLALDQLGHREQGRRERRVRCDQAQDLAVCGDARASGRLRRRVRARGVPTGLAMAHGLPLQRCVVGVVRCCDLGCTVRAFVAPGVVPPAWRVGLVRAVEMSADVVLSLRHRDQLGAHVRRGRVEDALEGECLAPATHFVTELGDHLVLPLSWTVVTGAVSRPR